MSLRTEKEASELWCPMVRIARHEVTEQRETVTNDMVRVISTDHVVGGCNTDALGRNRVPASCRCIASQCAMWRWSEIDCGDDRRGYCGLAGQAVHQ